MPVAGRPPKDNARNRMPKEHDWIEVVDVPHDGPPLDFEVCDETARWWEAVRTLPHAVLWRAGDWQFARDTARIHHEVFAEGDMVRSAELRVREKQMGTTLDTLRALRIRYVDPEPAAAQPEDDADNVTSLDARRDRLIDAS